MIKKFKLLFVLCAMSFLTLASAGIAEAKNYKVTPSKVVKMSKKKHKKFNNKYTRHYMGCLLYTSPSPRDPKTSRMPSSA